MCEYIFNLISLIIEMANEVNENHRKSYSITLSGWYNNHARHEVRYCK